VKIERPMLQLLAQLLPSPNEGALATIGASERAFQTAVQA